MNYWKLKGVKCRGLQEQERSSYGWYKYIHISKSFGREKNNENAIMLGDRCLCIESTSPSFLCLVL